VTALIASSAFSLLAFMGVHAGSGKVFNWFANMTAVAGLLTWFGISVTYIRFYAGMKLQGIDRATLPFASRLQPYAAWYALVGCFIICLVGVSGAFHPQLDIDPNCLTQFSGWSVFLRGNWDTPTFITSYLPVVAFPILYIGAKYWKRSQPVAASEMDFYTNIAEIEASTYDEPPPKNKWEAFWQWLVSGRVESFCMRSLIAFYIDVRGC
jgi:amino acid transporter